MFLTWLFFAHAALSALLLTIGAVKRKRAFFVAFALLLWLASLVSAFFVGWAWLDREFSENWAMFGVWFVSLPVIGVNTVLAVAGVLSVRFRRVEENGRIRRSLLSVLLFLFFQVVLILWSA